MTQTMKANEISHANPTDLVLNLAQLWSSASLDHLHTDTRLVGILREKLIIKAIEHRKALDHPQVDVPSALLAHSFTSSAITLPIPFPAPHPAACSSSQTASPIAPSEPSS